MDPKTKQEEVRNNLINLFQIEKLPEDKQEEAINKIGEIVFKATMTRLLSEMKEEELNEYEKLLDSAIEPFEMIQYLENKFPNFFQIVNEEAEKFKQESTEILEKLKN